jgi:hypothetical protein
MGIATMNMSSAIDMKAAMSNSPERRGKDTALPERIHRVLNDDQMATLHQKENFGWTVAFVRRPLFQPVEVVLVSPDASDYVVLDSDGSTRPFYNVRTTDLR